MEKVGSPNMALNFAPFGRCCAIKPRSTIYIYVECLVFGQSTDRFESGTDVHMLTVTASFKSEPLQLSLS